MKLAQIVLDHEPRLVLVTERGLIDPAACGVKVAMEQLLTDWTAARPQLESLMENKALPVIDLEAAVWAPPVKPTKICCVGLNYKLHAEEAGEALPEYPMIFCKTPESLNCCGGAVPIPSRDPVKMDFEAELVVVIGKRAYNTPKKRLRSMFSAIPAATTCLTDRPSLFPIRCLSERGAPALRPSAHGW